MSIYDLCVVGGCGHVGLPLAIVFASRGLKVGIFDIDERAVRLIRGGKMPFRETGTEELLATVLGKSLDVSTDPSMVSRAKDVLVVIGTPVDQRLNPTFHVMRRFVSRLIPYLVDGQCIILRSTVFPGTTERVRKLVERLGKDVCVAFCPERVAEGKVLEELTVLPQIVAGCDERATQIARELFGRIANSIIVMTPLEAELSKVFTNAWRCIQFATANQFFMVAAAHGLDFYRIYDAIRQEYPRMAGLPRSGFAAGPCLLKDTMQLAAANNNNFPLGHAAMLINEGLPNFIVHQLKRKYPLSSMRVGILGMAFKADCDDPRESLSYKLRKVLEYEAAEVLCTDVYIDDPSFLPLNEVVERSEVLFLGAPHREYKELTFPTSTRVIDIWNFFGKGASLQ